jgi:hypothetical protein
MEPVLVILILLTLCVIALVFLIVWRDHRDLRLQQIAEDIARLEEFASEVVRYKKEMEEMLSATRRQTEKTVSWVDSQMKQVRDSVASLEQNFRPNKNKNKKETSQGKYQQAKHQKYQEKGKPRGGVNPKQRRQSETKIKQASINDGETYNKLIKLAEQGLNNQEIAKQLNLGYDEVALILELKRKKHQLG